MRSSNLIGSALLAFVAVVAVAQSPAPRTLQMVVPFATGAANDNLARILANEFSESIGRVVIDNRPGGDGSIAGQFFKRAAPDGNSVMLISNSYAINAAMRPHLPYDVLKDFEPVLYATRVPFFLVINPESLPVNAPGELAKFALTYPGKLSFASPGNGSPHHLAMELFKLKTRTHMVHVPYKSLPQQGMADFMTGRVQLLITGLPAVANPLNAGKAKVLAVASGSRSGIRPDVPTFKEAGIDGVEIDVWQGILVPTGTPAAALERLNAEFNRILKLPKVRERLLPQGIEAVGGTPAEFGARLRADIAMYRDLVKAVDLKVE